MKGFPASGDQVALRPLTHSPVQPEPELEVEAVFRLHAQDVARWAARLGGPSIDKEDVLQEVFLTVHQALPKWRRQGGQLTTWLFRITENVVRHRRRKDRIRNWLRGSAQDAAGEVAVSGPTPLEQLEQQQRIRQFYRVLDGMNERYRTVLILFEVEELKGEEIAELLEAKVATVWVWLHRARADFLKRLQREEET